MLSMILVGLIAGWLAGVLMKGGGYGIIGDIVVGIVGAVVGSYLFNMFGLSSDGGFIARTIVATVGAVVLITIIRFIKRA